MNYKRKILYLDSGFHRFIALEWMSKDELVFIFYPGVSVQLHICCFIMRGCKHKELIKYVYCIQYTCQLNMHIVYFTSFPLFLNKMSVF